MWSEPPVILPIGGVPKEEWSPISFQRPKIPANSFDKRGGCEKDFLWPSEAAPCHAVPTDPAHLQPPEGHCQSSCRRLNPQPPRLPTEAPRSVRASAKPRPRAAAGLRPYDDLIAVGQWNAASVGCRSAESRGRGRDPACGRHLVLAGRVARWGWWCRCSRPWVPEPFRIPSP